MKQSKLKHYIKYFTLFIATAILAGCASTQAPIKMSSQVFNNKDAVIGIVSTEMPEAAAQYTGSIGLLDLAIISGANSSLNKHLEKLSFEEYQELPQIIKASLDKNELSVKIIEKQISLDDAGDLERPKKGMSKDDFSKYKKDYGLDYLVLLKANAIGTTRSYYGFIPTSEPATQVSITGQMIDLKTKKLVWYLDSLSTNAIESPWDEADEKFPNLTSALYRTLNESIQKLKFDLTLTNDPEAITVSDSSTQNEDKSE